MRRERDTGRLAALATARADRDLHGLRGIREVPALSREGHRGGVTDEQGRPAPIGWHPATSDAAARYNANIMEHLIQLCAGVEPAVRRRWVRISQDAGHVAVGRHDIDDG